MEQQFWDKTIKMLAQLRSEHFVQFIANGVAQFVSERNNQLLVRTRTADILYNVNLSPNNTLWNQISSSISLTVTGIDPGSLDLLRTYPSG